MSLCGQAHVRVSDDSTLGVGSVTLQWQYQGTLNQIDSRQTHTPSYLHRTLVAHRGVLYVQSSAEGRRQDLLLLRYLLSEQFSIMVLHRFRGCLPRNRNCILACAEHGRSSNPSEDFNIDINIEHSNHTS